MSVVHATIFSRLRTGLPLLFLLRLMTPPPPLHPPGIPLPSRQNALHERKWLAWLGLSVFLQQNPVMVVGNFVAPTSAPWGLASEMFLSAGISVFFVVTLCIADGMRRDRGKGGTRCDMSFYLPKVRGRFCPLGPRKKLVWFPNFVVVMRHDFFSHQNIVCRRRRVLLEIDYPVFETHRAALACREVVVPVKHANNTVTADFIGIR